LAVVGLATPAVLADQTDADATVDVGDLWRAIRHKPPPPPSEPEDPGRMIVFAPVIGAKPDTGVTFGAAGNIARYAGDPKTTHISSSVFSLTFSTKSQVMANVKMTVFTKEDRWLLVGDNRFLWTSQDTYGLGSSSNQENAVNADYDFFRVYDTAYRRVRSHVFVGAGLLFSAHRNVRPGEGSEDKWDSSPAAEYSQTHEVPLDRSTSGGLSVDTRFDTRDSQIDARRGWLLNGTYRAFMKDFLGGDSTWQQVNLDVRTYRPLTSSGRHRLAVWFYGDVITSGTAPYFDLPATGMDTFGRSGRGYPEGRFRGERLLYGELEYRTRLTANGLLGLVVFLNGTTVSALDAGEKLFDSVAPGGGVGLRVLLNKRSRTNLCLDFGAGRQGSKAVYLAVQEAF
jgi:hypothetical protein